MTAESGLQADFLWGGALAAHVDAVAIGGGISAQPSFVSRLRGKAEESFPRATASLPKPDIRTCRFFDDANLVGALLHHRAAQVAGTSHA
jgi:hypothetical protein